MAVLEHAQLPQEVVIQMNTGWILDSFGTFVTPPAWMQYMLDCDMDKSTAEIGSYHLQGKRNLPGVKGAIYLKAHAYSLYFQMCESTNMASIWMWRSTWIWIWNGTESLLDTRCAYVASDTAWTTIVRFFFLQEFASCSVWALWRLFGKRSGHSNEQDGCSPWPKTHTRLKISKMLRKMCHSCSCKKASTSCICVLPFGLSFFFLLQSYSGAAGFRPCLEPPIVPASCASCHDNWEIMMYKVHSGMGCSCWNFFDKSSLR